MTCKFTHAGRLTESLQVKTGVRQGCLLSPFMFLVAIDWILSQVSKDRSKTSVPSITVHVPGGDRLDTESLQVKTGVRQECLLSPFMFLVAIDWILSQVSKDRSKTRVPSITVHVPGGDRLDTESSK